jgi:hypothetical protein
MNRSSILPYWLLYRALLSCFILSFAFHLSLNYSSIILSFRNVTIAFFCVNSRSSRLFKLSSFHIFCNYFQSSYKLIISFIVKIVLIIFVCSFNRYFESPFRAICNRDFNTSSQWSPSYILHQSKPESKLNSCQSAANKCAGPLTYVFMLFRRVKFL